MITVLDCFQLAARCEAKALASEDNTKRSVFLAAAGFWRRLGNPPMPNEAARFTPSKSKDCGEKILRLKSKGGLTLQSRP